MDSQKKVTQYSLNTWKTERGLPNNIVLSIVQDRSGYLWLGTADGLVRFDGVNFAVFNIEYKTVFSDNSINNLYVDHQGTLWIATLRGQLLSLEQGRFKSHLLSQTVANIAPYCLAEDGRNNLWVGTSEGLFYRPPGNKKLFKKYLAFPSLKILCLMEDHSGQLLFSTINKGLYRLGKSQWRQVLANTDKLASDIYVVRQGRNGSLWLGTENGLYFYKYNRLIHYPLKPGMAGNIRSMVEDRDNNLWAGSEGGLYRWFQGKFQSLTKNEDLSSNYIYSLYEDAEGVLWVGTIDGGLIQVGDEKVTNLTSREGLAGELFRCLHQDASGTMWIGGSGGYLSCYQNGRCENFNLPIRFRSKTIWSLEVDAENSLWLGTSSGLLHFQAGRFREISLPGPAANIEIRCVLKDNLGRLWIGTYGAGLLCWQKGTFKRYSSADGLRNDYITCLFEDRRENLWVGSEAGLNFIVPGKIGKFSIEPLLNGYQVVSLYRDDQGTLWVGTRNQGLKVLQDGKMGSITADQGLFDNRIYTILEDNSANLCLSSERGIFYASKSDLQAVAWGRSPKVAGHLFTEENGLKSRICNNGQPAGWKSKDGRLWFATLKGVAMIDPAHLRPNDRVPPVRLEEVNVDQKNLLTYDRDLQQEMKVKPGSQRFEFKYTALSFIRSDKIEFKYKLEGYDRDWTIAGNRRQAFYNNLSPGRYRFRVIAANADGVWNMAGASFSFYLRPFIYQTWWFMVLAALAFSLLSTFFWQLLKKYLRAVSFWKKKTQIGHFKILENIGSGGMATIYKAQDLLNQKRIVALKVLKEDSFQSEVQKKRFKQEALITDQLAHPNIVHIIERGEIDDCWYIAMELLMGRTLGLYIKEQGKVPVAEALEIMLQIVAALQAIHDRNIIHRDLKPDNIMVSVQAGRPFVKLLDFGLAITPAQSRLTQSGVVMGTIRYLAPERISEGISSAAGDIYATGIIFYEMVTGTRPFWSEATGEVIHHILNDYPPAAEESSREIPAELSTLIMAMIDKDPDQRPALAGIQKELQQLLDKCQSDL